MKRKPKFTGGQMIRYGLDKYYVNGYDPFLDASPLQTGARSYLCYEDSDQTTSVYPAILQGNFIAPDFNGFRMVSGPNTSSSFSMINGVVTQKKAYSYVLMPEATGDQQIGEAIVSTDEDKLITDPVSVYVLSTDKLSPSSKSRQRVYKYDTPGMTKDTSTKAPIKKRVLKKI